MNTRFVLMLMLIASAASFSTRAQGNTTIYGVIDAGVSYGTDVVGQSKFLVSDGILIGNRPGFRGSEDLGGGTSAIFTLEARLGPVHRHRGDLAAPIVCRPERREVGDADLRPPQDRVRDFNAAAS